MAEKTIATSATPHITVTVRVENCGGPVTATHTITIEAGPVEWKRAYLPLVMRNYGQ